jgi:hypothetical protein
MEEHDWSNTGLQLFSLGSGCDEYQVPWISIETNYKHSFPSAVHESDL